MISLTQQRNLSLQNIYCFPEGFLLVKLVYTVQVCMFNNREKESWKQRQKFS